MKSCRSALYSFYTTKTSDVPTMLQYCPYDDDDIRALNDTCCSRQSTWTYGCPARPYNLTTATYSLKSNLDSQLSTCQSSVCTSSFLGDYEAKLNGAPCPKTIDAIEDHSKNLITAIRTCKLQVFGNASHGIGPKICYVDADCTVDNRYKCDPRYHVCRTDGGRVEQELNYVACVFNQSAIEINAFLALITDSLNLTAPTDPNELIPWLRSNVFSGPNCVKSYNIPGWYWQYDSNIAPGII